MKKAIALSEIGEAVPAGDKVKHRPFLEPNTYGEISRVGVLLLGTPCSVTVKGKLPNGKPSGNLTIM